MDAACILEITRDWSGNENQAYFHESKGKARLRGKKD